MSAYTPPFNFTNHNVNLVAKICEQLAILSYLLQDKLSLQQKRLFKAKTIHSSLAIEQNTLSLEQVTAIINGKRVLGHPVEILEVKNASAAYEQLLSYNPLSIMTC